MLERASYPSHSFHSRRPVLTRRVLSMRDEFFLASSVIERDVWASRKSHKTLPELKQLGTEKVDSAKERNLLTNVLFSGVQRDVSLRRDGLLVRGGESCAIASSPLQSC